MSGNRTHEARTRQTSSRKAQTGASKSPSLQMDHTSVLDLQRVIGNQAVQRVLAETGIQAKMTVGAADDAYEREADSVASQVMSSAAQAPVQRAAGDEDELAAKRMPDVMQRSKLGEDERQMMAKRIQRAAPEDELSAKRIQRVGEEDELSAKRIQRAAPEDELSAKRIQRVGEEDELAMKRVQREAQDMSDSFDVSDSIERQIQNSSGGGQQMADSSTSFFADHMGHDFSNVNIHTDSSADSLNRSIGARAFTTGNDIYFRSGEYNPNSSGGQELLAHELTHVVQQTGGAPVKPKRDDKDCADC
jgi:hypothetical protein